MMLLPSIPVRKLFQDNQEKLQLTWVAGALGADKTLQFDDDENYNVAMIGHLNFIHPNRIQVFGISEYHYFSRLENYADALQNSLNELLSLDVRLIIVANDLPIPETLSQYCDEHQITLLSSPVNSPYLMDVLRVYLQEILATSTVMHGVFLGIFETGVLITGSSGLGKSELALELISRGHRLIADDAVEIYRTAPEMLEGRCPNILRNFLEVRGLGILDISTLFGQTAILPKKRLELIIHLAYPNEDEAQTLDRLNIQIETQKIINVPIRRFIFPVEVGRNLAVLVETAVKNHTLNQRNLNAAQEFLKRHAQALKEDQVYVAHHH